MCAVQRIGGEPSECEMIRHIGMADEFVGAGSHSFTT